MTYANDTMRLALAWPDATDADLARIRGVRRKLLDTMSDGKWWSPERLQAVTGQSGSATTARIRELRQHGFIVDRRRVGQSYIHRISGRIAPSTTPRTAIVGHCESCTCRVTEPQQAAFHLGGQPWLS